jgi:hypothetical protein
MSVLFLSTLVGVLISLRSRKFLAARKYLSGLSALVVIIAVAGTWLTRGVFEAKAWLALLLVGWVLFSLAVRLQGRSK